MEPNESHHHHHQQQQQQQQHHQHHHLHQQQLQQQRLSSPYFHHQLQLHHHPTTVATTASTGNAVPSSNNGLFPPQPQPLHPNDVSSSISVYPHSVPSSAVTAPMEPLKRKRGRPRKYVTPEQALAAKKMASSASSSSAKERRERAALAGGTASSNSGSSKKPLLGSVGKTGQSFTPHIVNIAPGEDVAQKIMLFANQSKHELCVLSASGTISNVSLRQPATSGGNVSYEGQYEILSLSGSYIRTEQGGKTGGLSASLSGSDGQIVGGAVGNQFTAAGPVQVILGTFQLDRQKDAVGSGGKGDGGNRLTSPASTGPMLDMGFRPGMEPTGRNPMRGHDEHHHHHQTGLGGSHHLMMQAPQGMHMTHIRSEWGRGGHSGHDGRGGGGYDLSGRLGHESSENGDYEQQIPD
ncbi:PREDICTED: AT-hook motif nuclear-localized protein 14-like [Camelina sativa]|uniref:AT-hook motif nuclear-localized protein n=1 Tax=Camelina sativa TaxID=90675 RepID=A0ABM0SUP0_CAMSA|nr:PREDICTED: AT-hook motif nuclear-localized protein 14-like [Camelina sativa]